MTDPYDLSKTTLRCFQVGLTMQFVFLVLAVGVNAVSGWGPLAQTLFVVHVCGAALTIGGGGGRLLWLGR